jgi:2-polyprenyl-3-methyl-5-hydroxy-6-metoxy-1,4-benzoquinol methylase
MPTYPAYQIPSSHDLEIKAGQERYKVETVQNVVTKGRLLEIGPSYGAFAYLAKKAGFEVEAIEMDARCCAYLTDVVGVRAINSNDIDKALEDLMPYNVIALWHVIEHLTGPWGTLGAISRKLLPGGVLVVAAPNPSALQFRIFGRYWVHVDAPRHLQLIPMQVLIKHMKSLGLNLVMATTTDEASNLFSSFDWWFASVRNLLEQRASFIDAEDNNASQSHIERPADARNGSIVTLLTFARSVLLSPIRLTKSLVVATLHLFFSLILKPIERREGMGCAYTVVFKKD